MVSNCRCNIADVEDSAAILSCNSGVIVKYIHVRLHQTISVMFVQIDHKKLKFQIPKSQSALYLMKNLTFISLSTLVSQAPLNQYLQSKSDSTMMAKEQCSGTVVPLYIVCKNLKSFHTVASAMRFTSTTIAASATAI